MIAGVTAIPTFLILGGGSQVNGGTAAQRAPTEFANLTILQGGAWGMYRRWPAFSRTIPHDPVTGLAPSVPAFTPYWDGTKVVTTATSTGAGTRTITVSPSPGWTVDAFKDNRINVTAGVGSGQIQWVESNTANTITVKADWATPPTSSTFTISGAWVVYHHTDSTDASMAFTPIVPGCKGDNWYESGGGITACTMLQQLLSERFATAPYYASFKRSVDGGIGVGATPLYTTGLDVILLDWAAAKTQRGKVYPGETLDVRLVVIDASQGDITGDNFGVQAHLQTLIERVRAEFGTECLIVLVNHPASMYATSRPANAAFMRGVNAAIARTNDDVVLFDMTWGQWGPLVTLAPTPDTNPLYYDTETYLQQGIRLFNIWQAWEVDEPTGEPGTPIAVAVMITDSQGKTLNPQQAVYGFQGSILGNVAANVRAGEYVYNGQTRMVEQYVCTANACTLPSIPSDPNTIGPEVTGLKALKAEYPDGIVFFKFSLNGAALTTEAASTTGTFEEGANDLLPAIEAAWQDCQASIIRDLGRRGDVRIIWTQVGDNDCPSDAAAAAFGSKLAPWIEKLRDIFTSRADGPELGVVCLQPPKHLSLPGGQSQLGIATARETVRAAYVALAESDNRVRVLLSNANRYELSRADHIHYGAEGTYALGYDFAELTIELNDPTLLNSVPIEADAAAEQSAEDELAAAAADSPDIASYETPDGLKVSRRSLKDLDDHQDRMERRAARRRGLNQTLVRFD